MSPIDIEYKGWTLRIFDADYDIYGRNVGQQRTRLFHGVVCYPHTEYHPKLHPTCTTPKTKYQRFECSMCSEVLPDEVDKYFESVYNLLHFRKKGKK